MNNKKIRAFLAIPLPREIKERIAEITERLRKILYGGRFVQADALHITLHFFEEIDEIEVEKIRRITEQVAAGTRPFNIILQGGGAFPNENKPRVMWVGVEQGEQEMKNLFESIGRQLDKAKIPIEKRPFKGHLTLARFKIPYPIHEGLELIRKSEPIFFTADRLVFYKSDLKPSGPIYSVIDEFLFNA